MPRKKLPIDYDAVEKLSKMFCTQEEIASFIGVSIRTLQRDNKAMELYRKGIDIAKMSLRRIQYQQAMDGNTTMAIWLGKQYLGQKDKNDITHSGAEVTIRIGDDEGDEN